MEFYIGQIIMFGGNFAIRSFAECNGQLMAISSNTALFSILGTTYGGDGRTTFALPNLQSRVPVHQGTGPGLPTYRLGQTGGRPTHTLNTLEMPSHNHMATQAAGSVSIGVSSGLADEGGPDGNVLAANRSPAIYSSTSDGGVLGGVTSSGGAITVSNNGGSQAFNIMQPYLTINYEICLFGIFPSRN